jgi:hypothetical protein
MRNIFRGICFVVLLFVLCTCRIIKIKPQNYSTPGVYPLGYSYSDSTQNGSITATISITIESVEVYENLEIGLNIKWDLSIQNGFGLYSIAKYSDYLNPDMYLTDNLGNHYSMIDAFGYGVGYISTTSNTSENGTLVYPPVLNGIELLIFHDDDIGKVIELR